MQYEEFLKLSKFNISENEYRTCVEPVYMAIQSMTKEQCAAFYDVVYVWNNFKKIVELDKQVNELLEKVDSINDKSLEIFESCKYEEILKSICSSK